METQISELLQKRWVVYSFVGAISFTAGFIAGNKLVKAKPEIEHNQEPEKPEQMSLFEYQDNIEEFFEELDQEPEETYETVNVFHSNISSWDYDTEIAQRGEGLPYVIHYDEFMGGESGYNQETLTYYEKDDILADQSDTPIYNYPKLLGDLNFGHGSNDSNVVYIRNDQVHMEWEVLRHSGSYSEEVVGYSIEEEYEAQDLKHANHLKFRME
jgi:hypothetical protein